MGFGKDNKGAIITDATFITLGTLNDVTAVKQDSPLAITEDFRMISVDAFVTADGMTNQEGPITIGIADNELSVSEIAEAINAGGPLDSNDRSAQEQAERAVFPLFDLYPSNQGGMEVSNQRHKVRWTFKDSDGWCWFAYNHGGAALSSGGVVRIICKYYGVWVT